MGRMRLGEIAEAARGTLRLGPRPPAEGAEAVVDGWSIDTRTLRRGDLFFAIVGPRVDGHDYVDEALARGAMAVVVAKGGAGRWADAPAVVRVADTTKALQDLGAHARRRKPLRVVGITGSAGKTTAKEMTAAVLATRWRTHRSEGNLNNTWGLPLTLLRMADVSEAAALEMGMSYEGEIARLTEIADPDVGILLNVLRVHLEHFRGLDGIAQAKGELFRGLRQDAVAVYNADDPRVARLGRAFRGPSIPYGLEARGREVSAEAIVSEGLRGTRFTLRRGGESVPVRLRLAGRHHVYNALAAASAGFASGVSAAAIAEGLSQVSPSAMRGVLHERRDGVLVLDDTYNSNPTAMERAIELLAESPAAGRRVLAAGDMLELGPYGARAHAQVGEQAAAAGLDLFVAVGPLMERAAKSAQSGTVRRRATRPGRATGRGRGGSVGKSARGARRLEVRHFGTSDEAGAWLRDNVRPRDLVLVKGSRGTKMERVVQALLGETR